MRSLRRLGRPFKRIARGAALRTIRRLVSKAALRRQLNLLYNLSTPAQQEYMQCMLLGLFRPEHAPCPIQPGLWHVNFAGKRIAVPLTLERISLDWDIAVCILGHDVEVKQVYRHLICSDERPDLFIDIGANYGTHSILFLAHGIETISFEPNTDCHNHIRELCSLNNVIPWIENHMLGDSQEPAELSFPEGQPWLGSTSTTVKRSLRSSYTLISRVVAQRRLDDYLPQLMNHKRVLLKIDTEGSEAHILRGARRLMTRFRPMIIFESLPGDRSDLFEAITTANYRIVGLSLLKSSTHAMTLSEFSEAPQTNFAAYPI